jgi:hypothetical protein
MSLSVTATSSTLFVTGIPAGATSLTFASSDNGSAYTNISSPSVQLGSVAYSLTVVTIPSYYYRVTIVGGAGDGTTTVVQYKIPTKGETGSSTSSFTAGGAATTTSTSVTLGGVDGTATSDQAYPTNQGLYLQGTLPIPSTGDVTYNMILYDPTSGLGTGATRSIYVRVSRVSGSTTYSVLYRDGSSETVLKSAAALPSNPTQFSFLWDSVSTVFVYASGIEVASRIFTNAWLSAQARFAAAVYSESATPVTIPDVRLFPTGKVGVAGTSQSTFQLTSGDANYNTAANQATLLANNTSVQSTQLYTARQGLYLQASCPSTSGSTYNIALYERTPGSVNTPGSAANSIYVTISGSNYTVTRRDNGTAVTLVSSTAFTSPGLFSIYWDGISAAFVYLDGAQIATYTWVSTWVIARSLFDTTTFTSSVALSDIRFYPTGKPGTDGTSQSTWAVSTGTAIYNTGLNRATFLANSTSVQSTQVYTAKQGLYLQASCPSASSSTYNVTLYEAASSVNTPGSASNCIFVTISGSNYTVTRRDNGTAVTLVSSTAFTSPGLFSIYWDGISAAFVYLDGAQIATYTWVSAWTNARALFDTTGFGSSFSVSDIRFYPTGKPGTDGASQSTWAVSTGTAIYNTGLNQATFLANTTSVQSTQVYTSKQALYLQASCPSASSSTYNVTLYEAASSVNTPGSASNCIFVTVSGSNYTVTRRDGGTAGTLVSSTAFTSPGLFSFYWDGTATAFVYLGGVQIATYTWTAVWTTARALLDTTGFGSSFSVSDIRFYPTGGIGTNQNWRLNIQNVTLASLTDITTPAISSSTYGRYYYITNSRFNALTLPTIASGTDSGAFWVLRNNTSVYLSITLTGATGLTPPLLVIPPSNSATIIWSGTAYVLF